MIQKFSFKSYWAFLAACVISSCSDTEEPQFDPTQVEENRISCEYFGELQPVLSGYTDSGLKVSIPIGTNYPLDSINSYGFTLQNLIDPKSSTIENGLPTSSSFDVIFADTLICGFDYQVSAFISFGDSICTSKQTFFKSEESFPDSPWCAGIFNQDTGFEKSYGISINGKAFVIFQSDSFYQIDNNAVLIPKSPFPIPGDTGVEYAIFTDGVYGYFKSSQSNDFFRYDSTNDTWTNLGPTGEYTNTHLGGQLNGTGYIFDLFRSFKYDPENNAFQELSTYDLPRFISKFQTDSKIYVITEEFEILEFDESNGNWKHFDFYPGNKSEEIVSFMLKDKVYIGLSHRYFYPDKVTYYDMYEFDLDTKEWKEISQFPVEFSDAWGISSTSTEDQGYILYRKLNSEFPTYVWSFDPSKIVYK